MGRLQTSVSIFQFASFGDIFIFIVLPSAIYVCFLLLAELRSALLRTLPDYMVPSSFVVLEKLPLTANGKLDVRALPDPEIVGEGAYRAPETPTEVLLCDLYAELTGASRVGLDDSFFALGGDSITAIRLVSRVRQAGYALSVKDIFARPTVEALAEGLQRLEGETLAIAAPAAGFVAVTPIERQFLSLGGPLDRFHQAVAVEAPLGTTRERVEEALHRLMAHHDALRLRVWVMRGVVCLDDAGSCTGFAGETRPKDAGLLTTRLSIAASSNDPSLTLRRSVNHDAEY